MKTINENNEKEYIKAYKAYKNFKGKITPMNTEECRKFMGNILNCDVQNEDVLWCFYHSK